MARLMDAYFFNNHKVEDMRRELEFARTCNSSFRIQCWIDSSNELLLQHYHNIKYVSDLVNRLLTLEHRPDLLTKRYGSMKQFKQELVNLLKHSDQMLSILFQRWDILVEASIILRHVKNVEHMMALDLQKEQQFANQIRISIE